MPEFNPIASLNTAIGNIIVAIASYIPNIVWAFFLLIIGWIIGAVLGSVVAALLRRIKINRLIEMLGLEKISKDTGLKFDLAAFVGGILKWFIVFIFLISVADVLKLPQISRFITDVTAYIPNVIAAVVILVVGIVVADFLSRLLSGVAALTRVGLSDLVANMVKWAVWIFTFLAVLVQLQITPALVQILFGGMMGASAIALGIAFGLGGVDQAKKLLERGDRAVGRVAENRKR